jgi:LETM1 and EF-hand domain-containing protein 1
MCVLHRVLPYRPLPHPQNWLDLSLNRGMPSSLLLLSRAFTLTSPLPSAAPGAPGAADDLGRVKETLLTLPEEVIQDVGLEVAAPTSGEGRRALA